MASTTKPTAAGYTRQLAEFAASLSLNDVPASVIDYAKLMVLDGIGCGLFGSTLPWPRILMDFVRDIEGAGPVVLWGTNQHASCTSAAMVNGTAVHGFELDDLPGRGGRLHAMSVILPPLIAVGQQLGGITGRDALSGVIAGLEVGLHIGRALGPDFADIGWHAPFVVGVFPAAVAVGRAIGLDAGRMEHAFGLAATQAAGLHASHKSGAMAKRWHAGKTSQSGLYAALLASRGFTGPDAILEREDSGFCDTFTHSKAETDLTELTANLGSVWETTGTIFKIYSCRGTMHGVMDAIRDLRKEDPLRPEDVKDVTIWCGRTAMSSAWPYEPSTLTAAQMNTPFAVAVMLIEGDAFVGQYTDANLARPDILALTKRVHFVHDPEVDKLGAAKQFHVRVRVELKDGRQFETVVDEPSGSPGRPVSREDVVEKYRKLSAYALSQGQATDLRDAVLAVDTMPDIAEIGELLTVLPS